MSRTLVCLAALGLLLTSCGGDDQESSDRSTAATVADESATTSPTETSPEAPPTHTATDDPPDDTATEDAEPDTPCDAGADAEWLDLAGEGEPDAFQLGEGAGGVVLLHQNDGRACNWVPFAEQLAGQGFAVIVPVMDAGTWPQPVIDLAAEQLREDGSEQIALVGASMGGTYALAAAPELTTPPDLVVAVSAPDFYQGASARDVVADLEVPIVLVVAEHDTSFVAEAESMLELAPDADLRILPGALHGIQLLDTEPEAAQVVTEVLGASLTP